MENLKNIVNKVIGAENSSAELCNCGESCVDYM